MRVTRRRHLATWLTMAAPWAGCFRVSPPALNVGTKAGVVEMLVAEAIGLHLQSAFGAGSAQVRPALGGAAITHESLLAGQIDLYAEYSGVALTTVLGLTSVPDAASVREQVKANYRNLFRCEWLAPLGFTNPTILAAFRARTPVTTLSEAAAARSWRLGTTHEFLSRPDGMALLMSVYKLPLTGAVQVFQVDHLYQALETGQVTLVAGQLLDAGIRNPAFVHLADDRLAFPAQEAGIVVAMNALDRNPQLLRTLLALEGRFDPDRVARLVSDWTGALAHWAANADSPAPQPRHFAARLLGTTGSNPAQ